MTLFGFEIRRKRGERAREEAAEGTEVRLARLAEEVRAAREEAGRLAVVAARLEAAELAREAAFSKGIESLRSVLGRLDVSRRKSRPPDRDRGDDGDAEYDWLGGYLALRGHTPGAAAPRVEEDVTEEDE